MIGPLTRVAAAVRRRSVCADRRTRASTLVGAFVVGLLVAGAVSAVASAAPGVGLAASGHWVVNKVANTAVHVDGGTARVDAQVALPGDIGDPLLVAQGTQQGFVVARDKVVVFGRSTLTVDRTLPVESPETPVPVETVGGPYLVYRQAGTVVRLGTTPLTVPLGGPVDRPVWTDDGTVWLRRSDLGTLCSIGPGATEPVCDADAPDGALTVTSNLPAFLSSEQDAVQVIGPDLRPPVGLNTDVPRVPLVADRDTGGRLPILLPAGNQLVLADSSGVPAGRVGSAALPVDLGPGRFTQPVAADGVVAVVDESTNRLLTFDTAGRPLADVRLPAGTGAASIVRGGDGRIYVDDADGTATHVVGPDGSVTSVKTGENLPGTVTAPPPGSVPGPSVPAPSSGGGGVAPPAPPAGRSAPLPPLAAPGPPVAQVVAGGGIEVSWGAVDGSPEAVAYRVEASAGTRQDASGTSTTMTGLPPGTSVSFSVTARTATRTSAPSGPSAPVLVPETPAAAPEGVRATTQLCGPRCSTTTLTWGAPDLGGGELLHYLVSGSNEGAPIGPLRATTNSMTLSSPGQFDHCLVADVTVRAITRSRATGALLEGATGGVEFDNVRCEPFVDIVAVQATGPTSATVALRVHADVPGAATCTVAFRPAVQQTVSCPIQVGRSGTTLTVPVSGLTPGTRYSVQATADDNAYGRNTSKAVTFAAPQAVVTGTVPQPSGPSSGAAPPTTTTPTTPTTRTPSPGTSSRPGVVTPGSGGGTTTVRPSTTSRPPGAVVPGGSTTTRPSTTSAVPGTGGR